MLRSPSSATARLVVHLQSDRVYCIPKELLPDSARCNGFDALRSGRTASSFVALRDLATSELFLLPKMRLPSFSIPDEQIGYLIRQFEIRGIRTAYKAKPRCCQPAEVPLHGNVTNRKWAGIRLGGSCNSHCVFCYTHWTRSTLDLQVEQIKAAINRIAEIGTVKVLSFSGGEPTIRRDLVLLFEYANGAGFTNIELQTNGRELRNFYLAERLAELGLKGVLLSLHGPNYDYLSHRLQILMHKADRR